MSTETPNGKTPMQNPVESSALFGISCRSRSESAAACCDPHTESYPVAAYKDGHLTLSGWLLVVEGCPDSQSNFAASGRTPQIAEWSRELLSRWRESGYPDLGAWPPEGTELFAYSLGVICGVLMPNDRGERRG